MEGCGICDELNGSDVICTSVAASHNRFPVPLLPPILFELVLTVGLSNPIFCAFSSAKSTNMIFRTLSRTGPQ